MSDTELKAGILAYYDVMTGLVSVRVLDVSKVVDHEDGFKVGEVKVCTTNDDVRGFPKGEVMDVPVSALVQRRVRVDRNGHLKVRSF
jgi:hypothetical protein